MVCEAPRQRQLLVSRRGTFFEDPFFKDGWEDYSHAVRRIVDRFNHGWVSPSERWRDSQYHSMYRTLRTARLNYSTHSARFKEEGNVYKLVMDVKDFVGGDITVRTAGGTVSVRGKLEVKFEDGRTAAAAAGGKGLNDDDDDDDDRSTESGRSSTAKTLHRRFTLPADADCDKVESSLSKDAVLTVTIPKRTDVHYIPVTLESDMNKENESINTRNSRGNSGIDTTRQSGVKRPSDTPQEASRKKSQDETYIKRSSDKNTDGSDSVNFRRKSREVEAEGKRRRKEQEELRDESSERRSRRRDSKYEDVREISIPIRFSKAESPEKVFRPTSIHENDKVNENLISDNLVSSHNLEKENKFNSKSTKDILSEQINSHNDETDSSEEPQLSYEKIKVRGNSATQTAPLLSENCSYSNKTTSFEPLQSVDKDVILIKRSDVMESRPKPGSEWKAKQLDKLNSVIKNSASPIEGVKPVKGEKEPLPSSDLKLENNSYRPDINKSNERVLTNATQKGLQVENHLQDGLLADSKSNKISSNQEVKYSNGSCDKSNGHVSSPEVENEHKSLDNNQRNDENIAENKRSLFPDVFTAENNPSQGKSLNDADSQKIIINLNDSLVPEKVPDIPVVDKVVNGQVDGQYDNSEPTPSQHNLQTPKTSFYDNSASSVSPGGRDVPVEKRQSLMEEDMFKDCWSDFSNTLQDVLTRLQELSSELGVSKIVAATPSEETPHTPFFAVPKTINTENSDLPCLQTHEPRTFEGCKILPSDKLPSSTDKDIHAHGSALPKTKNVGVIDGREGGAKDESRTAYTQQGAGHGPRTACNLDEVKDITKDISQTNLRKHFSNDRTSTDGISEACSLDFGPYRRPLSLHLQNVATPARDTSSSSGDNRRSSLLVSESPITESLLPDLRKNSPVEALQERFHQWRKDEANRRHGHREETRRASPVGGLKEVDGRPLRTLSPSEEQSSCVPGQKDVREEAKSNSSSSNKSSPVSDHEVKCESAEVNSVTTEGARKRKGRRPPPLNDLNARYNKETKDITFEFNRTIPPNIDASPESNVTDESESGSLTAEEGFVEGRFTFPIQSPRSEAECFEPVVQRSLNNINLSNGLNDVTTVSDAHGSSANKGYPEILSDDVMGCERPLAPSARVPLRGANEVPHRSSRFQKHREPLILREEHGDAKSEREADAAMGGAFSRGRKSKDPPAESPKLVKSPSPSPSVAPRGVRQITVEEKPIPPYVRQRSEVTKRHSGFAHVNSDNVRRMRDVWGSRQDAKPPASPSLLQKVLPDSPTRTTFSRRTSDVPLHPRTHESPETRHSSISSPSDRSRSSPLRKTTPSPTRSPASASLGGRTRFTYPEIAKTAEPNRSHSAGNKQRPSYNSPLRQSNHDRVNSPTPPSPNFSRRCTHGSKESSPRLSPPEKKINGEFGKRSTDSPSRTSRLISEGKSKGSTSEPPPGATRAHQKIFKRLRNANLQPDSEAICFKEEEDRYKMVLDVEEFVPGEIEVLQDDRVLTVKGRVETKEGGGRIIVKTFNRTFNIPKNSKEEDIDSALSQDGILIIFVPKKRERIIKIELVD